VTEAAPTLSRLEDSPRPAAIVHEGFFVYANPVFLSRLGYRDFEELQAVPLLDLVAEADHERLRNHLDAAKKSAGTDKQHPHTRLTLRRADDLPLIAQSTAFSTRYGGENCVQLNLSCPEDEGVSGRLKRLPWRHYLSIVFLFLFTVLPSSLLLKLNIDNSLTVYFPDDEPAVVLDRELRERFPNDQVFVLLFEGVALFSDGFLSAYDEMGRTLLRQEAIDDVLSLTRQDHIAGTRDEFVVERLIDVGALAETRPAERMRRAVDDRFSRGALVSTDGSALAMVVIPADTGNSIERLALEEQILQTVATFRLQGYLTAIAGQIPVDVAQLRSMLRDNMIFIPATVSIGLALIWWLFRRWLAVMLAGVAIGVVVNTTVAIYVLVDQPFTLVTSIIPPLLSALTVAALVHLFNALYLTSKRGLAGAARVSRAVAEVERPALFAALTTAAGLASLATSSIIPIRVFGLISAAGTLLIYAVVFKVLPNVVARWDRQSWPGVHGSTRLVDGVVASLYRTGLRYPLWVAGISLLVLGLGAPQVTKVVVETNLQEFFDQGHQVRVDTRHIDDKLIGTMPLAVTFDSAARDGLKDPVLLAQVKAFQTWLAEQPEVDRSLGLVDFIEEMHWGFNAEDPAFRALPDDEALISQYLLIYDGDDMYDVVDRDFQHAQLPINLNVHSANQISQILERIRTYLSQHVGDGLDWEIAGIARLFADMEDLLVSGQVYSLWGALVLIFVFMLFLLRSVGAAVLCMIPNLSPILLIFVIMGAAGIWLDMATAMIASVAIGIAVDDTIHVFHGFQRRVRAGTSPVLALARTYRSAGRAVVTTTLILSAQFLILVTSDFVPTRNFGLLTAAGLVTALLFDLLLLPALLILLYGPKSPLTTLQARLGRKPQAVAVDQRSEIDAGFDEAYWTVERRVALVREILGGRHDVASAARDYALPEGVVRDWLSIAERAIGEAMGGEAQDGQQRLQALTAAYARLQEENRELREFQHIRNI
jgi:predicted RND superfamily exporter protein/transposase-like protein